ncbi:MAG: MBL fold metallo-hydrolase, partial [Anaerolineaceae bacterium]|nr:MBL fold metallo-hydrolase [Anaerolineaceae bacterium]
LVIDAFYTPLIANDLRSAAERLTGRSVDQVLITHHHGDHILGCQAFSPQTDILAAEDAYVVIRDDGQESLDGSLNGMAAEIKVLGERLQDEGDDVKHQELAAELVDLQVRYDIFTTITLRLPNQTCKGTVKFIGSKRQVEFIPYELGHSPGNAVIFLPDDGILHMGDLLFARGHPFMGHGDPDGWLRVLEAVEELAPRSIIPGHGALSTLEEVKLQYAYIETSKKLVLELIEAGKGAEALSGIVLPEPFDSWEPAMLGQSSLEFLYQHYSKPR